MPESNLVKPEEGSNAYKKTCFACNREKVDLLPIPDATLHFLETHSLLENIIKEVCKHCLDEFESFKQSPATFLEKKKIEMVEKKVRWQNRVGVIRSAYQNFRAKKYKEAKELYLDYVKTIELCLGVPLRDINSSMFVKNSRAEELSPLTLSLWDLIVICDKEASPPSAELTLYATKFIELSKDQITKKTILHTIKKYKREAKNKKLFKQMLIDLGSKGGCFIATFLYQDAYAPQVMQLRKFRDRWLMPYALGRLVVKIYYCTSPLLVELFIRWRLRR
jgi:hypothetical protein